MPKIIDDANKFFENPVLIDDEKEAYSKATENDKKIISILKAFIMDLPTNEKDFDLIVDSAYYNIDIILRI